MSEVSTCAPLLTTVPFTVGDVISTVNSAMVREGPRTLQLARRVGLTSEQAVQQSLFLLEVQSPVLLLTTAHCIVGERTATGKLASAPQAALPTRRNGSTSVLAEQPWPSRRERHTRALPLTTVPYLAGVQITAVPLETEQVQAIHHPPESFLVVSIGARQTAPTAAVLHQITRSRQVLKVPNSSLARP